MALVPTALLEAQKRRQSVIIKETDWRKSGFRAGSPVSRNLLGPLAFA